MTCPIDEQAGTLVLRVRATPKASRNAIQGTHEDSLKVSVQAPPENGKANDAIRKLLAKALKLRPSQVELKSGKSSRDKRFQIEGLTRAELEERITKVLATLEEGSQKQGSQKQGTHGSL